MQEDCYEPRQQYSWSSGGLLLVISVVIKSTLSNHRQAQIHIHRTKYPLQLGNISEYNHFLLLHRHDGFETRGRFEVIHHLLEYAGGDAVSPWGVYHHHPPSRCHQQHASPLRSFRCYPCQEVNDQCMHRPLLCIVHHHCLIAGRLGCVGHRWSVGRPGPRKNNKDERIR